VLPDPLCQQAGSKGLAGVRNASSTIHVHCSHVVYAATGCCRCHAHSHMGTHHAGAPLHHAYPALILHVVQACTVLYR
jgi:hypothetical protein